MDNTTPLTDVILATLKERDLLANRDAIEASLKDPISCEKTVEWVSKHLKPETLLSREELTLWTKLESSSDLHALLRDPELDATRPLLEDEIQTAIQSLEASTAAIRKHTETLSLQCRTIKKQIQTRESLDQDRIRDIARLRKKHEAGTQNTRIMANELSDELDSSLRGITEKIGVENKRILSSLSTQLKHDDRILANLESTISGVKSNENGASSAKRATQLSEILAELSADEIHYRLDRLYLETIHSSTFDACPGTIEDETIAVLEEELESLHPEIEILSEMYAKQQFHEPILREVQNEHDHLLATSQQKLEQVCIPSRLFETPLKTTDMIKVNKYQVLDLLVDMTLSKQALTKQLGDRASSCELFEQLASLYQAEAGSPLVPPPSSRRESLRRRSMQPGMLLTATRNPVPTPEQPALESLLRRIGVSPESVLRPRGDDGGVPELYDKRQHLSQTLQSLRVAVDSPLVTQLTPSDHASQRLFSSLQAHSHYEPSLRDPDQEQALSDLEVKLSALQKGLQGLHLDVLHQRDKAQDRFLERWT
ncbi:hypothetical protein N7462_009907 [Penicillium macrosclerotiorum]|uniref:uncharacterized protein n=1 Tax=Penicillium macrosclerotiorum TaxID=303699 RepID=UPI0025485E9A|nr:uncharacterized protein N7462_009907 [Penicillium macrosclerotiorum]KAJ5668837.1 hypothetical protein N7462_009907 [Penicillium macrosclerotiorum]